MMDVFTITHGSSRHDVIARAIERRFGEPGRSHPMVHHRFVHSSLIPSILLLLFHLPCHVAGAESRVEASRQALAKATSFMRSIATEGGYVYLYAPDLSKRTAERPATTTQIAIQPPGTPSMGMAFLCAYAATGDAIHLDAARAAAQALGRCRLKSGGWHATADFDPAYPNEDGRLYHGEKYKHGQIIKHTISTTFDDDATQGAVRFLLALTDVTSGSTDPRDAQIRQTLDQALQGMMRAQYPNGAWPQCYYGKVRDPKDYPIKKAHVPENYPRTWPDADYTVYYTLNDNCHADCVRVMLQAWKMLRKPEYLESAKRGADFLLLAQLPEPQPAWAQQYDFDMAPAWARSHEAPSVSSSESGNVIAALLDIFLQTGEQKYLDAVAPAAAWLERSARRPNHWSRLYELGTNRPIFGDDRGVIAYSIDEISHKSATGYTWESKFGIPAILARYEQIKKEGREAVLASSATVQVDAKELESRVDEIVASLDAKGRWISSERWKKGSPPEPVISTKTISRNMQALSDYLLSQNVPDSPSRNELATWWPEKIYR
jgi:PelA/Pel-15E family pectate lyase